MPAEKTSAMSGLLTNVDPDLRNAAVSKMNRRQREEYVPDDPGSSMQYLIHLVPMSGHERTKKISECPNNLGGVVCHAGFCSYLPRSLLLS
jgi:hypothetical protein